MQKTVVKYAIIVFLLAIFINRGLFVIPYEAENQGDREINSVIEWIFELVTGESNDIDEDSDLHTDCSFTHILLYDFPQQPAQINIFSKDIKTIGFPDKESFLLNDFCSRIDRPPQV